MGWRATAIVLAAGTCACSALVSLDDLRSDASAADASADSPADAVDAPSGDVASSSITFVQAAANNYGSGDLAFLQDVADGDVVIVVSESSVHGAVTLSDTKSNTWQKIFDAYAATDGATVSMFVAFGVKGGFTTMHVSASDAGPGYIFYAAEYRGISAFDVKASGFTQSTGKDALVSSSVDTTASPELLFAYANSTGNVTPGSLFTQRSNFDGNVIQDRIVTIAGNYQATATISSDTGDIMLACFH